MRKLAHWTRSSNCCKSWSPYGLCWRHASVHQEIIWIILLHYSLSPLCIFSLVCMCSWWSFFEEILCLPVFLLALLTFEERAVCMAHANQWCGVTMSHCMPTLCPSPLSPAKWSRWCRFPWRLLVQLRSLPWCLCCIVESPHGLFGEENTQLIVVFCLWLLRSYEDYHFLFFLFYFFIFRSTL